MAEIQSSDAKAIQLLHENRGKFGRADNLDPFKLRKGEVPFVASAHVRCSGCLGTLQDPVVRLVRGNADHAVRMDQDRCLGNFPHETGDDLLTQVKFWPAEDLSILVKDHWQDTELDGSIKRQHEER